MPGPEKINSIDIRPIQNLYLENLIEVEGTLGPEEFSQLFQGSDLYYNAKTRKLDAFIGGKIVSHTLYDEAEGVNFIKNTDLDGNGVLRREELAEFVKKTELRMDPDVLFNAIDQSIKIRYGIVAKNAEDFLADVAFKPLLESLDAYNGGIYLDDLRQASSVMPLNGLTKTALNILTFLGNAGRLITKERGPIPLLSKDTFSDNYFFADHWAAQSAESSYKKRSKAIQEFRQVIAEGRHNGEAWAKEGDFAQAFPKLSPDAQRLLTQDIPAKKINDILSIADGKKRHEALLAFAEAERPGFLGYFGGNATGFGTASFFNYTGRHNNLAFARSVLFYLNGQAKTEDPDFDKKIGRQSTQIRSDMLGDGGNFTTTGAWGVTGLLHLLSFGHFEQTPWRRWADESKMDAVGRGLDAGITLFLAYKSLRSISYAADLAKASKLEEVLNVVKKSPLKTLLNELSPFAKESLFETQRLALGTDKVLLGKLGITTSMIGSYYLAKDIVLAEFNDSYNPYEANYRLNLDPYPDPTKPDPEFYPQVKK